MKKVFTFILCLYCTTQVFAQYIDAEKAATNFIARYNKNYEEAALAIASECPIDKNGGYTYVQVIEAPDKTKEQLYILMNTWYLQFFNGSGTAIAVNDKELGCIVGSIEFNNIVNSGKMGFSTGGWQSAIDIKPTIRTDIKDGKVRVTYTNPYYSFIDISGKSKQSLKKDKTRNILISESYPYNLKDKYKKFMSEALVKSHVLSLSIIGSIEEALKNGIAGNENDDW